MPAASSTTADRPREPLVDRLVGRRESKKDPRDRLREILDRWRVDVGQTTLPIDVFGLASARGVHVRKAAAGDWDGRVYVDENGRVTIEVDPRHGVARQRFTVAHELAHTAFPGFTDDGRYRVDGNLDDALFARTRTEEERLCDWGASVLLMPDDLIWSYRADQGLRAVERLARDAKVSLESAALRITERSAKPTVVVVLDPSPEGLEVRYARVHDLPLFIPRGASVAPTSVLARAAQSGRRERGEERLPGRSRRVFHVEAKSYPIGRGSAGRERVLAMAWPRGRRRDTDAAGSGA